jgi:tetratricopeptide (TPR) repeat protein
MSASQLVANRFAINDPDHDLLGRGGMGAVYRATDTLTGELVAVKVLDLHQTSEVSQTSEVFERFAREGEALRQLNHPNIVRMVAAVEENGQHYLVMEYVSGGSLEDLLARQGRLPPKRVAEIALEVADALTRAHHLGIIHRDLKPANVLLVQDGTPRLADFGIAYLTDIPRLTQTGVLVGTVDYLSPEICQGEPPDECSDIWAFGVMLFQMLTGSLPFEGKSLTAKITAILTQPVPDLVRLVPEVPDALAGLVRQMLEKDPRQRVPSVRLVGSELEGILKGRLKTPSRPTKAISDTSSLDSVPPFLRIGEEIEKPVFVTREAELAQLHRLLERSLAGNGQVVFITGDPGQGKTALAQEFAWRAQQSHPELLVAGGNCNAYTGIGDPYLPFREVLGLLTGDIESRWEARAIDKEQAGRLWQAAPLTVQALVESGRDLVDIFVPGDALLMRAATFTSWPERNEWLPKLEQLVERKATMPSDPSFQQGALFEQFTRVLRALAHHKSLLLILDDLQWADSGSIHLLLHLGRKLEGSRVMVVGAYRPTEVALGRGGERHPLATVVNEFKRQFGEIEIDLSQAEGRTFVNFLLDTEPNRLDDSFREEFFRISNGHPLTTIELLRDMQERGGLVKDAHGCWIVGRALNWESLPVRVEATIAERMGRLDEQELSILRVAGVQGEGFSVEVVARVLGVGEAEVIASLSRSLDREHHLVSAQGIRQINDQRISLYRFRHILFQKYLYNSLDPVECAHMHQQVGNTLQALYGSETEEIAVQLATHFQKAGTNLKAADYSNKAGDRARELVAHQEAIDHYQEAIAGYEQALGDQWEPIQRAVLERKIGESFYRRGEHMEAIRHFDRAMAYLGLPLPDSRWGIRSATFREALVQIAHRTFPQLLVKPIVEHSTLTLEEVVQIMYMAGWIEALIRPERFLMFSFTTLNLSEKHGYGVGIASSSVSTGIVMLYIPILWVAERYYRRGIAIAEQVQNPFALEVTYSFMGLYHIVAGDPNAALDYESRAREICLQTGNLRDWGFATEIMGSALWQSGKLAEAEQLCKEMLQMGRDSVDSQICCWAQSKLGHALRRLGKIEEAVEVLQESYDLGATVPDYAMRIEAGAELGRCFLRQGELAQAISVLEATEQTYFEHDERWGVSSDLYNALVDAYLTAAGQSAPTIRASYLEKAKRASRTGFKLGKGSRSRLPDTMWMRGRYEWLRGKPDSARKWWQKGLVMAEKQGELYDLASIHAELGLRFNDQVHLERAVQVFSQIGAEWDLARAREALGNL